jgi:hypothetical protein
MDQPNNDIDTHPAVIEANLNALLAKHSIFGLGEKELKDFIRTRSSVAYSTGEAEGYKRGVEDVKLEHPLDMQAMSQVVFITRAIDDYDKAISDLEVLKASLLNKSKQ